MAIELLNRLVMFGALFLAQVLILNHVHLFDVATPLLYVYYVITFRRGFPKWIMLVSSFVLGLVVDIFSSTPGLTAGSMTLVALLQPYILERLVPRDSADDLKTSAKTLSYGKFSFLSGVITAIYCLVFFTLEAFSFFDWLVWMERILASIVLTWILLMAIETVLSK